MAANNRSSEDNHYRQKEEIEIPEALDESELLAIYGRRRAGKTFLIKNYYSHYLSFSCSGQYLAKTKEQLVNFAEQLATFFPAVSPPPTKVQGERKFKCTHSSIN